MRILRNIAIGFGILIVGLLLTAIVVVRTDWFRNFVRQKIITVTEESTGGTVEVGSFSFDVSSLRAVVTNFVIHGNEPAGADPFVRAARLEVRLRLPMTITYLGIERPAVNIISFPDGRTNIPNPKQKSTSNKTTLETVVDLAVRHFELTNGLLVLNAQKQEMNVRANNLRAQLAYNILTRGYEGQFALDPVYVVSGRNTPVNFRVTLPVVLGRDRIDIKNATITTPASSLQINGSIENLRDPKTSGHVTGHIALIDVKNAANVPLVLTARNVPTAIDLDANATVASNAIQVNTLHLTAGHSNVEASGSGSSLQFQSQLALGEIGRLVNLGTRPEGMVGLGGNAKLDPHRIDLTGMRLTAFGGELTGDASLEEFARYRVNARLEHLDIQTAARAFGEKLPYDGVLSGPLEAQGDLNTKGVTSRMQLAIAPARRGIPVSGRLNANYNGNDIGIENSYLALPHTRVDMNGALGNRLNVKLTTRDLHDLLVASPVLTGGQATFAGAVTGSIATPRIAGHLAANRFSIEGRPFDTFDADVAAANSGAAVHNGSLTRRPMAARFDASAGLRKWSPTPNQPVTANVSIENGDLADVMVLAGEPSTGYSGALTANARIGGTIGNPTGSAVIQAANGTIENEPFDRIEAHVNLADQLVTIPAAYITAPAGRADLTAEFQHPRDSFATGRVHAHLQTAGINLAQVRKDSGGVVQANTDVSGVITKNDFLVSSVNGNASARGLRFQGADYGDLQATARTNGQTVSYNVTSNFAGSNLRVNGNTQLTRDYPTNADANLSNLPIERVLTAARRTDIPARGRLSGTAHFTGTMANPQGNVDLDLANAVVYDEPIDRVHARITYLATTIDVPQFEVVAGPSRIDLGGRYDHSAGHLESGNVQFHVNSSRIDLARIKYVQNLRPGVGGTFQVTASGAASIQGQKPPAFSHLDANIAATGMTVQGKKLGDANLTAATSGGRVNFSLDSNLASATIRGRGSAELSGNYSTDAQVTFNNVRYSNIETLLGPPAGEPLSFDAVTDGEVRVRGPITNTDQLSGSLQLSKLQANTIPRPGAGKAITIQNQGPITAALDRGVVRIESAHVTGPQTDMQATGTVSLPAKTFNLNLNANVNLGLLQNVSQDIYSAGSIVAATTVRGTFSQPLLNGRIELHDASLNYSGIPNGISKANGLIVLNGNSASIRNLTAESGGGKLTASGFMLFSDGFRFGLRANASNVRVRVQQGVSVVADADIRLTGVRQGSALSGTITIDQLNYAPQSDIGSLLTRAGPPVEAPTAPSPFLDNMKLDIRVRSSPSLAVQASLAQNVQADADLRVRGTAARPAVLGRVVVSEGQLVFFGSTYTVNSGTIGFYNPVRIEPILNINLETQAKGVDVVLTVTGPIDNMKLSYTSDPPLQFQEIVSLLASGRAPTSDPNILANQPVQPPQTFQQMGESAVVSQALADPIANRLQRVFGVSQLKIDPSFSTGSSLPTAQLTLQQQISSNLTFTYVSALDDPNSTIIRVEWAFDPQWSAVATRDQNGIFSINFFYKRQFR